jgi:hypothetical protein
VTFEPEFAKFTVGLVVLISAYPRVRGPGRLGFARVDIRSATSTVGRHDMRVMMLIEGDREPGHVPSEELLSEMDKYNEELTKAGVLVDLGALHWSAEGVRVEFFPGKRTVIKGPFGEPKEIVAGYWILQVKSMDEAIEWAKRLPFEAGGEPEAEGEIEIRSCSKLEELS